MTAGVLLRSGWRRTSTLILRWVMSRQATFMTVLGWGEVGGLDRKKEYRTCVLSSSKCGCHNSPMKLVEVSCCALPFDR